MNQIWLQVSYSQAPDISSHLKFFKDYVLAGNTSIQDISTKVFKIELKRNYYIMMELNFMVLGWSEEVLELFQACLQSNILKTEWSKVPLPLENCMDGIKDILEGFFDPDVETNVYALNNIYDQPNHFTIRFKITANEASLRRLLLVDNLGC